MVIIKSGCDVPDTFSHRDTFWQESMNGGSWCCSNTVADVRNIYIARQQYWQQQDPTQNTGDWRAAKIT